MLFSLAFAMLTLQSSVRICTTAESKGQLCFGTVGRHRGETEPALLAVYTREGPKEAHHIEHRCSRCGTGYWHGYYTKVNLET